MVITAQDAKLKPGYKQTEVGVIPEDWEIITLKRIVENNRIPSGIYKEKELYGSGTKIIKLGDVFGGDYFESHIAQRVFLSRKELLKNQVYVGDIIISLASVKLEGVGKVMYVNNLEEETAFDHNVALIRTNNDCDSEYIFYYLKSDKIRDVIRQLSTQVGTTFLKSSTIQAFKILLPPTKHEQIAITTVLSDTDALIEHLNKLISKKREIKQATMQQLLTGKTRLPGFTGEWEVKKLDEIAEIDSDNLGNNTHPDYSFKYISLEDVDNGVLKSYSEINFRDAPSRARRKVKKNDILVSTVRPNLKSHLYITNDIPDLVCSTGFSVLRCYQTTDPGYVYFHLFAEEVGRQIESLLAGSNYPAINGSDVRALRIPFPPLTEQQAIAAVLSDMDAEIAALEQRRDKTRALKQGKMQELLAGKTRLV